MSKLAAIALRQAAADLERKAKELREKADLVEGVAKKVAPAKKAKTAKKAAPKKARKVAKKTARKAPRKSKAAKPAREPSSRSRYAKPA